LSLKGWFKQKQDILKTVGNQKASDFHSMEISTMEITGWFGYPHYSKCILSCSSGKMKENYTNLE